MTQELKNRSTEAPSGENQGPTLTDSFKGSKKFDSSPTAGAFSPANAMVLVGVVQLNKISQYLIDLPDEAKAEYILSPKSTATLFGRDLGTFNEDTASIRGIDASHGLHFNGQALTGMQIFDRPSNAQGVPYEKAWADKIRADWETASTTHTDVVTSLAIMPRELINGRKIGSCDVTVANNIYSRVGDINVAITRQGGELIITQPSSSVARRQFTASELPGDRADVFSVHLTVGVAGWARKDDGPSSSRAGALHIIAPNP